VGEVREGFSKGQKGSSAMPHKRNPITAENLTGLARLLRSYVVPAMEDVALWHERDISHSSVERVIGPDANLLADYMLSRLHGLLENLEIFPVRMEENLNLLQGVIYSQRVLLALVEAGLSRDEAYEIIQRNSHAALDQKTPLKDLLLKDPAVGKRLNAEAVKGLFDQESYFRQLDYLYKKVLQ
jgi:adenylosuccinate lyase